MNQTTGPSESLFPRLLARSLATIFACVLGVLVVQFGAALSLPTYLPSAIFTVAGLNWVLVAWIGIKLLRQRR